MGFLLAEAADFGPLGLVGSRGWRATRLPLFGRLGSASIGGGSCRLGRRSLWSWRGGGGGLSHSDMRVGLVVAAVVAVVVLGVGTLRVGQVHQEAVFSQFSLVTFHPCQEVFESGHPFERVRGRELDLLLVQVEVGPLDVCQLGQQVR